MKSLIKTVALGALTLGSLAFSFPINALTTQVKNHEAITTQTIFQPQSDSEQKLSQVTQEETIAQAMYCETRIINGYYVTCCADSYGNWACW